MEAIRGMWKGLKLQVVMLSRLYRMKRYISRNRLSLIKLSYPVSEIKLSGSKLLERKGQSLEGSKSATLASLSASILPTMAGLMVMGYLVYSNSEQNKKFDIQRTQAVQNSNDPYRIAIERGLGAEDLALTIMAEQTPLLDFRRATDTPTMTPENTLVPKSTETKVPTLSATEMQTNFKAEAVGKARYSYYWPPLGGANCHGDCIYMANGLPWRNYIGFAIACPESFPFGTRIRHLGKIYECMDRGGAIVWLDDNTFWIDFLDSRQRYPFWTILEVEIDYP